VSIFVWLPATPTACLLAVCCMTHHQTEQDSPDASEILLHTSNNINLPISVVAKQSIVAAFFKIAYLKHN
jgi:hypothetical protein